MTSLARIARDAAWLFGGRLASQALTVLLTVLLAARLGLAGLGEYAFVAAVVAIANVATTFGTDMVLIRDIAGDGRADRWPAALAIQLGLSAAAIGLIWAGAPVIRGESAEVVTALQVYSLSLVPSAAFSVSTAALRGAGRMGSQASLGVAVAFTQLAAIWLFTGPAADLDRTVAVLLGVQCMAAAMAWAACVARVPAFRSLPGADREDLVRMARASAPIGLLGLVGVLYQRAGVIALSVLVGPTATGWFAGAAKVVEASKSGHVALYGALYPAMARAHGSGPRIGAFERVPRWSLRLSLALAALVTATLLVLGPLLVRRLYGPAFAPASAALALLALSVVPSTLATYRSLESVAARQEGVTLRALVLSLVALLTLLALLIPLLGWLGACWAVLGAEVVQAVTISVGRREGSWSRRRPILDPHLDRGLVEGAR